MIKSVSAIALMVVVGINSNPEQIPLNKVQVPHTEVFYEVDFDQTLRLYYSDIGLNDDDVNRLITSSTFKI